MNPTALQKLKSWFAHAFVIEFEVTIHMGSHLEPVRIGNDGFIRVFQINSMSAHKETDWLSENDIVEKIEKKEASFFIRNGIGLTPVTIYTGASGRKSLRALKNGTKQDNINELPLLVYNQDGNCLWVQTRDGQILN